VITVSILPFKYFTESITGEHFKINVLVPPGASPAAYDPTPSVVNGLSNSDAIIYDGHLGFELAWMDRLNEINRGVRIVVLAEGLDLLSDEEHAHGGEIHYSGVDPHFWMSPFIAVQISERIRDLVIDLDPENSEIYHQNFNSLVEEIGRTRRYLDTTLLGASGSSFMIFHPSLGYLARDYGLRQLAVEVDGKEPSPSDLKGIIDLGRGENIKVIMVQREFDMKNAATIAEELGAEVIMIDPLAEDWNQSLRNIGMIIADNYTTAKKIQVK